MLGSDLQVVCVWCVCVCVCFFLFVFLLLGGSCLSLFSLFQKHPPRIEKQDCFYGFASVVLFVGVSLATPKETKQKKRKRVTLLWGPKRNKIKQKQKKTTTPTPNKRWGRVTLLCGHHPKPSKSPSPKTKVTKQKKPKQQLGGVKRSKKYSRRWCRNAKPENK